MKDEIKLLKDQLEESKSKILSKFSSESEGVVWAFADIKSKERIYFKREIIYYALLNDLISFGLMTLDSYHNAKWIGE
ncbi:hypothetical protein Sd1_gp20 [Shigella phage Sd1]|uniref:Uncharacterized protein n=1 Tax=Shigella phage Sd1 TaxID=2024313 RepID=A0A291AYI4_9CAUD|nr:hypothetical protein HOR98_gp19 [Shigella phage Sd1]ATE86086.1 hypothetical protein Sd1_gp20 [Shigella phage Sd1]